MNSLKDCSSNQILNAQIAMTLSALAYDTPSNIGNLLLDKKLATGGNWDVVWGPCVYESNLMYVAKSKTSNDYMVTIRGTIKSVWSVFEDVDSFSLTPLPWLNNFVIMISSGMNDGWSHLNTMVDSTSNLTLEQYIASLPSSSNIFVTGHSQGGALASVVAYWLYDKFNSTQIIIPYTFAGETAGVGPFAQQYNQRFANKGTNSGLRFYNDIDIVPKGFADLASIKSLYGTEPPFVNCPDEYKLVIDLLINTLPAYEQPGTGVSLPGPLIPIKGTVDIWNRRPLFDKELEIQHNHLTYLYLLGAPLTKNAPPWPPANIPA